MYEYVHYKFCLKRCVKVKAHVMSLLFFLFLFFEKAGQALSKVSLWMQLDKNILGRSREGD